MQIILGFVVNVRELQLFNGCCRIGDANDAKWVWRKNGDALSALLGTESNGWHGILLYGANLVKAWDNLLLSFFRIHAFYSSDIL